MTLNHSNNGVSISEELVATKHDWTLRKDNFKKFCKSIVGRKIKLKMYKNVAGRKSSQLLIILWWGRKPKYETGLKSKAQKFLRFCGG